MRAIACDNGKGVFQRVSRDDCAAGMRLLRQGKQDCRALNGKRFGVLPPIAQGIERVFYGLDGVFPCVFAGRIVRELLLNLRQRELDAVAGVECG